MKRRLKEILAKSLPENELGYLYNSYDIVGDIAILRLSKLARECLKNVAEAVMNVHKNVQVVLVQSSPVHGDFRIRKLEHVMGEKRARYQVVLDTRIVSESVL